MRTDILKQLGGISHLDREKCRDHGPQPVGENLFCPFLRYEGRQAKCQIYETKPEACTIYRCGERSSATRLRVELNPQNCYEKTMEMIRQKWLSYLQDLTQEKNKTQVVIIGGENWPHPGEFDPEELPRLRVSMKWERLGEKCLQTIAELKRYLIWGDLTREGKREVPK